MQLPQQQADSLPRSAHVIQTLCNTIQTNCLHTCVLTHVHPSGSTRYHQCPRHSGHSGSCELAAPTDVWGQVQGSSLALCSMDPSPSLRPRWHHPSDSGEFEETADISSTGTFE